MRVSILLSCVCVLCSCAGLRSTYATPETALPPAWDGPVLNATVLQAGPWWTAFGDPVLNGLIEQALARNNDLASAAIRVRTARLQARLTGTNVAPDVSVGADTSASRALDNGSISREHGVSGSLSYEVDLWGKLAAARDAAEWEAQATDEDRLNTRLALIASVAETYWNIASLNERIVQAEASIATARQTLELVSVRHEAGAVSGLDLTQARQDLAARQSELPALVEERVQARLTLSLLFDQPPQTRMSERRALPDGELPEIAAGLPAGLLARRPDLRAAELRLRASLAEVDQAQAGLYPALTLTGSLGSSSLELRDVLDNPIATLGAGLALPFVQWNTVRLNIEISQSQHEEAVVNFRQTLYAALSDVEKALAARLCHEAERAWLEESLVQARLSEDMTGERYRAGALALRDWLATTETRRAAEIALAGNRLNRLTALMEIYLALGGDARATVTPAR